MDQNKLSQYEALLRCLREPAFLLEAGSIVLRSAGAAQAEADLADALQLGLPEGAASFVSGRWSFLCSELDGAVLVQASPAAAPDPMLSASARSLRDSLTELTSTCGKLIPALEQAGTEEAMDATAGLNHSLYRMLRAVSNMELAASAALFADRQTGDLCAFLARLCEEAAPFAELVGHPLVPKLPARKVPAAFDEELLTRAVMNLVSNALQYAAAGTEVTLSLSVRAGTAVIRVSNQPSGEPMHDAFSRSAKPSLDPGSGAGLGLTAALRVAQAHGGTLVYTPGSRLVTAALSLSADPGAVFRSPAVRVVRSSFDRMRMELSELLPAAVYRADEME